MALFRFIMVLPSERGTEKREGLASTSWGFEQRVTMAFSLSSVEGGDYSTHECKLRPVRLVRKFHLQTSDVVNIFRVGVCCSRDHFSFYTRFRFQNTRCLLFTHFVSVSLGLCISDILSSIGSMFRRETGFLLNFIRRQVLLVHVKPLFG